MRIRLFIISLVATFFIGLTEKDNSILILGEWENNIDPKNHIVYTPVHEIDIYDGDTSDYSRYYIYGQKQDTLAVLSGGDTLIYHISELDDHYMQLAYYGLKGNLGFVKIWEYYRAE